MKFKQLLVAATLLATSAASISAAPPKREFRSIWMAAMGIDWPYDSQIGDEKEAKAAFIEYIDNFKRHNIYNISLQVRPLADALYRSSLEPWSASVSGTRGVDPGWDPLAFAVEECHKRGMELYAWINPFRIDKDGRVNTTPFDLEWREKGWELKSGNWTIFNIAEPGARRHCLDVIREIYTNYNVDGIIFDDYFYPGDKLTTSSSAGDWSHYKASGTSLSIADWRRQNVNEFVAECYAMVQEDRPDMRFGIGPAGVAGKSSAQHGVTAPTVGYDWQYDDIFADPLAWLHEGTIDFISPQIYWSRTESAAFEPLANWWNYVAQHFGRHNYISMAAYRVEKAAFGGHNPTGWGEIVAQIEIGRRNATDKAPGQVYFSAKQFDGPEYSGMGDWVEQYAYQRPAITPVITWKEHYQYNAPAAAAYADGKLTWQATKGERDNSIIRYTVYAVPLDLTKDEVMDADGDGIDGKYLLGMSYATEYTLPAGLDKKHWYAVCVLDGYGYESEPALVGYSDERSAATTLLTPATDAVMPWDATFTWQPVEGADYVLEVSSVADFSTLLFDVADINGPSCTIDLSDLRDNSKCYWRVAAHQPGKLYNYTEAGTFYSPTRVEGAKATLTTPAGGSVEGDVTFSWQPVADASRYFLQLSRDESFGSTLFSTFIDAPTTEYTLSHLALGTGRIHWRIITHGKRINSSISDAASFDLSFAPMGTYEAGYNSQPAQPTTVEGDFMSSVLWTRTTADASCPLTFSDDGKFNRSMVATDDYVFITGRESNSKTAAAYLRQYNALTGEHLRDLPLGTAASVANYPCNHIIKDSQGNVYVIDYSSSVTSRAISINRVDLSSGALTEIVSLKGNAPVSKVVEYAAVYGDIASGDFYVFAAVSKAATMMRWTVEGGEVTDLKTTTTKEFVNGVKNFGTAPRIVPVSKELCWIDGSTMPPTLYNVETGEIVASFNDAATLMTDAQHTDNGFAVASLGGMDYYAYNTGAAATGSRFMLTRTLAGNRDFSALRPWLSLNDKPLGTALGAEEGSAVIDFGQVSQDDNSFNVYIYSPGNGLSAVRVFSTMGVESVTADRHLELAIAGRDVTLSHRAVSLKVYTPNGALVASQSDAQAVTLPAAGTYIIVADDLARPVTVK